VRRGVGEHKMVKRSKNGRQDFKIAVLEEPGNSSTKETKAEVNS
jgi:hypothetical protein